MKSRKEKINYIVLSAVIAAFYAGLTFISGFFGLAYGPIQFRLSEVLNVLAVFTPAAIPGLTVGCFLSNIMSYNPVDMLFGTAATLISAVISYLLRNKKIGKLPFLSFLSPVLFNSLLIGLEISLFFGDKGAAYPNFILNAAFVALGEAVICFGFGTPFYFFLEKYSVRLKEK